MPATATWSKLRNGAWGVSVQGSVTPGDIVEVTKRSGETSLVTICHVLGTRKDGSASLCTISRSPSPEAGSRRGSNRSRADRCHDCGGPIQDSAHHAAMGGLCGSCAFDEYDC